MKKASEKKENKYSGKYYNSRFATTLRSFLDKKEFNQELLAKELNVARQTISLYANGNSLPDIEKMIKIINFFKKNGFDYSCDYWLGLIEEPSTNIESKAINKKYGLTEKSLKNLEKINKINVDFSDKASTLINTINILLSEEFHFESGLNILEMIDSYIHKNSNIFYEVYSNGDIILKNTKKAKNEYFYGNCEINASLFSENMLPKITERLVELKKEGEKNECEGTGKKQKI